MATDRRISFRNAFFFLTLILAAPCASADDETCKAGIPDGSFREVSIFTLLADPRSMEGCDISVAGAYGSGLVWSRLYATGEFLEHGIEAGAIHVNYPLTMTQLDEAQKLQGKFVRVSGRFHVEEDLIDGSFRGELRSVKSIVEIGVQPSEQPR